MQHTTCCMIIRMTYNSKIYAIIVSSVVIWFQIRLPWLHWYRDGLYFQWGTPSSPGSPPGSKHPGLKGGPLILGQEPGLKGDL